MNRRDFIKTGGIIAAAMTVGSTAKAQPPQVENLSFRTQPYLQNLTPEKVTIMWLTSSPMNHSWVEYGEDGLTDRKAVTVTRGLIQAGVTIQRITLSGLTPSTKYSYRACSQAIYPQSNSATFGNTVKSDIYTFTTPGVNDAQVAALVFNDLHDNHAMFQRMIPLANLPDYDFVFLNGDILDYVASENNIIDHIIAPLTAIFASERPFMTVRGNHEPRHAFARNYFDYFQLGDDNTGYYTFRRGPVFFIALDSGEDKNDGHEEYYGLAAFDQYRAEETLWLERQLKTKECRAALFRVVFIHIPPYHPGDWYGATECRRLFCPLFEKYKVDMVISGDTHHYAVHPPDRDHSYPIVIGGGRDGQTAVIRLLADAKRLSAEIIDYNGNKVGEYIKNYKR